MHSLIKPFIPTEGAPAATACSAYSICTSFPEGLKKKKKREKGYGRGQNKSRPLYMWQINN